MRLIQFIIFLYAALQVSVADTHYVTLSLTSALDGGGLSTPRLGRFTPAKDPVPIV